MVIASDRNRYHGQGRMSGCDSCKMGRTARAGDYDQEPRCLADLAYSASKSGVL